MSITKFHGGVHPRYMKELTSKKPARACKLPEKVVVLMHQHIGCPCEPIVKVGDKVKTGQKVGDAKPFVSAPVHATVSGEVVAIEKRPCPLGTDVLAVVIESDGKDKQAPKLKTSKNPKPDQIQKIVRGAGIVGLGGAAFPTHVKLCPPKENRVDFMILNGCECEPYLTADHRIMLEQPEKVVSGMRLLMKAAGIERGAIGIESNKTDAIEAITKAATKDKNIEVVSLPVKYPQGAEKTLIKAITGKEVPPNSLPLHVGIIVNNVGTAKAVHDAVVEGKPLVERIVTVTGDGIKKPQNVLARIGTPFSDIIGQCGGTVGDTGKLIMGGPMMGLAQYNDSVPVIKGTSGILLMQKRDDMMQEERDCIRCSRCIDACPVNLQPTLIAAYSKRHDFDAAEQLNAMDCFECGCCSYVCPSKIPLVHYIKLAKAEITARRKAEKAKQEAKK